jgi:hypothetical protein
LSQGAETDLTNWTPAYLALDETTTLNRAVDRFQFHIENGTVEIQKVLVNTTKSTTGAVTVLDFTGANANPKSGFPYLVNEDYNYDYGDGFGEKVSDGKYRLAGTGDYVGGGNFGSGAAHANSVAYWIFIIKTTTADTSGLGDIRFVPKAGTDPDLPAIHFSSLEF